MNHALICNIIQPRIIVNKNTIPIEIAFYLLEPHKNYRSMLDLLYSGVINLINRFGYLSALNSLIPLFSWRKMCLNTKNDQYDT